MKAVVIKNPGEVLVEEVARPRPAPGEVLLRMVCVGFCGSDLNTYLGKNSMVRYPRIPGHEISGVIAERGEGVPDRFRVGEHVTAIPYTHCGSCSSCRRGRTHACRDNRTLGVQRDGAMQEYLCLPCEKILLAPELNALELALVEPLTVGFHAINRGRVEESDRVVVLGCGMIGSGAIVAAAARGAKVAAVDLDDRKLELAGMLGADHLINSGRKNLHQELGKLTGGEGPDVVVEASGSAAGYRAAIEEVSFAGRVVCIGYTGSEVFLNTGNFVRKEIDVLGSRNAEAGDFRAAITYLGQGTFPLDQMITERVKPGAAALALKRWAAAPAAFMKILLDFNL